MHLFVTRAVKWQLFKRLKSESAQLHDRLRLICQTHIGNTFPNSSHSKQLSLYSFHTQVPYTKILHACASAEAQVRTRSSFQFCAYTCRVCSLQDKPNLVLAAGQRGHQAEGWPTLPIVFSDNRLILYTSRASFGWLLGTRNTSFRKNKAN